MESLLPSTGAKLPHSGGLSDVAAHCGAAERAAKEASVEEETVETVEAGEEEGVEVEEEATTVVPNRSGFGFASE
jgi:hypothetical protein